MFSNARANLNSFFRRNFNSGTSASNADDEESIPRQRNIVYSMTERVFGQYLPMVLYAIIMVCLITGAIVSTVLIGEVPMRVATPVSAPIPIIVGDIVVDIPPINVIDTPIKDVIADGSPIPYQYPASNHKSNIFQVLLTIMFCMSLISLVSMIITNRG
jgi:hypothetical protein